jgi:hypothetical protein
MVNDTFFSSYVTAGASGALPSAQPTEGTAPPIATWLASPEARVFGGRWVLITSSLTVLDSDLSPSALQRRRAADVEGGAEIVFVPGDD